MKGTVPPGTLPQDLIDGVRIAFQHLDHDHTGKIDVFELQSIVEALGMRPTEEELFQLMSEVDVNMTGLIDFAQLLKLLGNTFSLIAPRDSTTFVTQALTSRLQTYPLIQNYKKNDVKTWMMVVIWWPLMWLVVVMLIVVDVSMRMY